MQTKLKEDLLKHRERKAAAVALREKLFTGDMAVEAQRLLDMMAIAEALRNAAIVRYLELGVPNKDVAKAFGLTPSRTSQIRSQMLDTTKLKGTLPEQ